MKPGQEQVNCIISDEEMEMALRRMMREQFAASEPGAQSWQKLHNRIVATAPIDAHQEVQPRVINNPLAWVNLFVPRVLQVTFAVVFMLATVLNAGADVSGFNHHHNAQVQTTDGNTMSSVLDARTIDPPVKNDPNLNRRLEDIVAARLTLGSNAVDAAEHVRPQSYAVETYSLTRTELRVNDEYLLQ